MYSFVIRRTTGKGSSPTNRRPECRYWAMMERISGGRGDAGEEFELVEEPVAQLGKQMGVEGDAGDIGDYDEN